MVGSRLGRRPRGSSVLRPPRSSASRRERGRRSSPPRLRLRRSPSRPPPRPSRRGPLRLSDRGPRLLRRGPRSSPLSSRPRPRRPTSLVVTRGSSLPEPRISSNSGSGRASFGGRTEVTSMPSMNCSTSTRSTSPTEEPAGTSWAAIEPRGCRAPAARQVQAPSSRVLVSSISMRGMFGNASRRSGEPVRAAYKSLSQNRRDLARCALMVGQGRRQLLFPPVAMRGRLRTPRAKDRQQEDIPQGSVRPRRHRPRAGSRRFPAGETGRGGEPRRRYLKSDSPSDYV